MKAATLPLTAGAMGLALLLSACGSPEPAPEAADTASTAPAAAPAAAPATAPAAPAAGATLASLTGDATRGAQVFNQCKACHAIVPGQNGIGPSLHGVVGREAGSVAGYAYSPANKNSHLTWDADTLFTYLESPMRALPGTKMTFALRDAQQRADVIAYLQTVR